MLVSERVNDGPPMALPDDVGEPPVASKQQARPVRRDALDRERLAAGLMIRFVVSPDGQVLPDLAGKLPGRGVWLKPLPGRIEQAAKRGIFARAAKRPVKVSDDLATRVEGLLAARMLETASLARRAGQIVIGFDQVQAEMKAGRGGVLLLATDAGNEAKRLIANRQGRRYVAAFERGDLGAKLGRAQVVYAMMVAGALAERMVADARRLAGFRDFEMALTERSAEETAMADRLANEKVSLTE